jgi:hypothetical protein
MHNVPLPEDLYQQAILAAKAQHVSLESLVAEAVQVYLLEEPEQEGEIVLTPEQVAKIRKSQAEIKAGRFLTMEQVREQSAARRVAWLEANPS